MSVYRDTNASVVFEHPHPGPLTATVYRDGVTDPILAVTGVEASGGKYTIPLDYDATEYDGKLTVVWTATGFERKQAVNVVTPIVPLSGLRTLFEDANPQDAELADLEKTVRVIIETYTGQKFGYSVGARSITGTGGSKIILDQRLNTLTSVEGGWPGTISVGADNFSLIITPEALVEAKAAPPEEFLNNVANGDGGVIRVPDWYIKSFNRNATYTVTGEWGYNEVPDEVQEAALLLANDYLTGDSGYRDRYLSILKIQQDSFTYHPGAFRGTGNARADLLLAPFRRKTGMIIL